jgi:S1-C subfamily serine protease
MKKKLLAIVTVIVLIGLQADAREDLSAEDTLKAVVKLRSVIPKEAPSAATLGTEREGNGVVIDDEGTILTIGYLIREAETIEVAGPTGKPVRATFLGYDFDSGFGLVRADKSLGVAPIKLGESSAVKSGDPVLIAGYGGEDAAQRVTVVSRHEFAGYWEYLLEEAIYTVPAYTNFSGAALINPKGQLVGIGSLYSQLSMPGLGVFGCNVFVPIDLLQPILSDLKKTGRSTKPQKPWLGINAEESRGRIFLTKVTPGGPAEKAGLKPGDILLSVDGKEVKGLADLYRKVWAMGKAGVSVPLSVLQGAKVRDITVRSIDRDQYSAPSPGVGVPL